MRFPIAAVLLDRDWIVRAVVLLRPWRILLPRPRIRHVLEVAVEADISSGERLTRQA